jgi:hypothetical protein
MSVSYLTTDPVVIYDDNREAFLTLLSGNAYRQNLSGSDWINIADPTTAIESYPTSYFTPTTTSTNYIPAKLIASTYGRTNNNTQLYSYSPDVTTADNIRLIHRLTKFVYKYSDSSSEIIAAITSSVMQYFYKAYLIPVSSGNITVPLSLSNTVQVYNMTKQNSYNNASAVVALATAIDALKSLGSTFTATSDPRMFFLPTTSYTYVNISLASKPNLNGYISYMDLYNLRPGGTCSDPTYNNAYPFFDSLTNAQQHGLGYLYFLTTQEGLCHYDVFSSYIGKEQPTTSQYENISVYSTSNHIASETHNIVDDIDQTYWAIANVGTTGNTPILMCVLIDGINYSGGNPSNPALSQRPTTSFDIYTCCDSTWSFKDDTPTNNGYGYNLTAEMISYQMVNAALTKNYPIFCKLHRMYYFMLYCQNGTTKDTNNATVDFSPIGTTQYLQVNRNQNDMEYTSYCMGYLPYLNYYGKYPASATDATTKPIYYGRNPYYKRSTTDDGKPDYSILSSAADADFNFCFAYKLASLASTLDSDFAAYDTLSPTSTFTSASASVSAAACAAVGASSSITWDYMYNQIKTTILAQTGSKTDTANALYSTGSTFFKSAILQDKYITNESHDSNQYNPTLHPDYIDLALFQDWVKETEALDVTGYVAEGSQVLTSDGYVSIEDLTYNANVPRGRRFAPVLRVECVTKHNINMIKIRRNAFGNNLPFRTLLLPVNNEVFIENFSQVVNTLVNKRSIRRFFCEKVVLYRVVTKSRFIHVDGILVKN